MSDRFDAYEYVGVIAPGAVAIAAGAILFPEVRELTGGSDISVGDLGLFVILSYVAGHLLQAVGSGVEWLVWRPFGGMPTQWVLISTQSLIAPEQRTKLFELVGRSYPDFDPAAESASADWPKLTRGLYITVSKAKESQRIDAFNRTYGLMRGIASGFLIAAIMVGWRDHGDIVAIGLLLAGAALSFLRMWHFGVLYARELLVTFIDCA